MKLDKAHTRVDTLVTRRHVAPFTCEDKEKGTIWLMESVVVLVVSGLHQQPAHKGPLC